jgi:DNA-binding transcriptional LysR family regulator
MAKAGALGHPSELSKLPCILDTNGRSYSSWRFVEKDGSPFTVPVSGQIEVNSPLAAARAAVSGIGVAVLPDFIARPKIASGELVTFFDDFLPKDRGIYAIYPHRRYLPTKVRTFVDFLHSWFRSTR